MALFLGIDLGTSSLKSLIIDETSNVLAMVSEDYQFDAPYNGYAQQETEVWWRALCNTIRHALHSAQIDPRQISGISFSGQMHGLVMIDDSGEVIYPSILHCDSRSDHEVQLIRRTLGADYIRDQVLNPIYTGFLLPSLLWVKENDPVVYDRIRFVMLPKDYLRYRLTGSICSDFSDASATLAYNIIDNKWSEEIIHRFDLNPKIFPECTSTLDIAGRITSTASRDTGLTQGTPVIAGGGDQVMQALGNGAANPEVATINIGSSGQVCYQTDQVVKNPEMTTNIFCAHEPHRWIVMGATMTAGLSFKWFNQLFGKADYMKMSNAIDQIPLGSQGLIFLPHLNGERTPHANPNLSGMFAGLNLGTTRNHMGRAVMEGVTFSLYQCMEACNKLGIDAKKMIASGGGARSPVWLQMQADIFNKPIQVSVNQEQACLGAAIAASVGSGVFSSVAEASRQMVKYQSKEYEPDAIRHERYSQYYQLYKELYEKSHEVLEKITIMGRNS